MSITRQEFETSLARLYSTPVRQVAPGRYALDPGGDGDTVIHISFDPLPKAVLGGLLALPRARVTLDMQALRGAEQTAFLQHFDKTFQRGGG